LSSQSRVLPLSPPLSRPHADAPTNLPRLPHNSNGARPAPFVRIPDNIQPGVGSIPAVLTMTNPYAGKHAARRRGREVFIRLKTASTSRRRRMGRWGRGLQDCAWPSEDATGAVIPVELRGATDGMPSSGGGKAQRRRQLETGDIFAVVEGTRGCTSGISTGRPSKGRGTRALQLSALSSSRQRNQL